MAVRLRCHPYQRKRIMLGKDNSKPRRLGRIRLDTFVNGLPRLHDVRMLASEAEKNKGCLCELLIKGAKDNFLLSCQSDSLSSEPCWTLYSGEGTQQLWSYIDSNVDVITDVVAMTISERGTSSVNLSELGLAPESATGSTSGAQTDAAQAGAMGGLAAWASKAGAPGASISMPATGANAWPQQTGDFSDWPEAPPAPAADNQMSDDWSKPSPEQNSWAQPGVGNAWAQPSAGDAWPTGESPAAIAPTSNLGGWPQELLANNAAAAGADMTTPVPAASSPQPATAPAASAPLPETAGYAAANADTGVAYGGQGLPGAMPDYGATAHGAQPVAPVPVSSATTAPADARSFLSFLETNKHLTIGELVFNANLPSACVDAAMRLQELVCKNAIDERTAREAIKIVADSNGLLDDNVLTAARVRAADNPEELARKAAVILQQAGFVNEQDIAKAEATSAKVGGTVGDALIASGKVDKLLLESAQKCHVFVNKGSMRSDQAIIALHYCSRMRAPLEDALTDLSIDII
jgi:hypothetical protein